MPFNPVNPRVHFPEIEKQILKYWEENAIFQKSLDKPAPQGAFVFYEGPPTANGMPGIHHVLARAFKDAIPRYKTMRGYRVARQAGWDTHGLPVELQVEKELEISGKQQIESIKGTPHESVAEFNRLCRESVWKYKAEWEELTQRMGYWLDLEHPYVTYENSYIESIWGIIKKLDEKKLLYKGHKVVPYCWSCGTALSSHEVAQGYKDVTDQSAYVKFRVKGHNDLYWIAWTTTPWTLPGNVALAINPNLEYGIYADPKNNEDYIISVSAGERWGLTEHLKKKLTKGDIEELRSYEPLFDFAHEGNSDTYSVVMADFVTDTDGTGVVHIAPAFGEDDYQVYKNHDLPILFTVGKDGRFIDTVSPWAGKVAVNQNENIIKYLEEQGSILAREAYKHSYPHCWRCDNKLIYYAKDSWFIAMSTVRDQLKKNNTEINWVPDHLKDGRFGEWLENVKDWNLSRDRYWGTPLPVWETEDGTYMVIGSSDELRQLSGKTLDDLHKPFIDEVTFKKDGKTYRRTPEVMDVWFDSGAMPIATHSTIPADYISEAIDQTRGWFYTMHAITTALELGPAFKNVICLGHILDSKGQKMSKSKGNVLDPIAIGDAHGFDAMRWYMYTVNQPGEAKRVGEDDIKEQVRKLLLTLWNTYSYFVTYANLAKFTPTENAAPSEQLFDQWLVSKKHTLIKKVTEEMDGYNLFGATRAIQDFIAELSTWYVRLNKDRAEESDFLQTLYDALVDLTRLLAPFTPFVAEEIYHNLTGKESVHLEAWPLFTETLINTFLEDRMSQAQGVIEAGNALRKEFKIRNRQPLNKISVLQTKEIIEGYNLQDDFIESLIKSELNIKHIEWIQDQEKRFVVLDTNFKELIPEGLKNDLVRLIQDTRKNAKYAFDELVSAALITDNAEIKQAANTYIENIKSAAHLSELSFQPLDAPDAHKEGKIGEGILATIMVKK